MARERALSAIITYKFVKAGVQLASGVTLTTLGLLHFGLTDWLHALADALRHHSSAWSLALAKVVVRAATRRGLWTLIFALLADGGLTALEGWALLHGRWWGPWLVVVATGSLLPLEVVSLVRHPHVGRLAIFLINVVIVAYLVRKALRDRRDHPTRESNGEERRGGDLSGDES